MSVVKVGHMRMRVRDRLVLMRVRVSHPGRQSGMNMSVVSVIVTMAVRMRHGFVPVFVFVAGREQEVEPCRDAGRRARPLGSYWGDVRSRHRK